jgi:hypothetical protein
MGINKVTCYGPDLQMQAPEEIHGRILQMLAL